ncbi:MAG: hypothetical protein JNK72_12250 [Myxococcales bacterium]|nr:hypothetical protein [Myxococcales bacterium]
MPTRRRFDDPPPQVVYPPFTRLMRVIFAFYAGGWVLGLLLTTFRLGDPPPGAYGWLERLALIPSAVTEGRGLWRVFTHALVLDPHRWAEPIFLGLTLWFMGGTVEARWGLKRLAVLGAVSTLLGAALALAAARLYLPWWNSLLLGPTAFHNLILGAWALESQSQRFSFLGVVEMTGRHFYALLWVFVAVAFVWDRNLMTLISAVGLGVAALEHARKRREVFAAMAKPSGRGRGALRVIEGGRGRSRDEDLPN